MKLDVQGPNKTVRQVIDMLRSAYKLETNSIIGKQFYYDEMQKEHQARLEMTIEQLYEKMEGVKPYEGQRYIPLTISATTMDGDETTCPLMRYALS
jgi:Ubiquitin fold domain